MTELDTDVATAGAPASTPNSAWALEIDTTPNWVFSSGVFTKSECDRIIEIGTRKNLERAGTFGTDQSARDSHVTWLYAADDMEWVFRRLTDVIVQMNTDYFGFDLFGFIEGLQFTRYEAPSGFYGLHMDKTTAGSIRKLSLTLQLSADADYEGGELALQTGFAPEFMPKGQGDLVVFPSYVLHEVRPVTRGTRYSLVGWITGAPFQ